MAVRVGINGFGRIGRQVLKAIMEKYPNDLEVVAFNDLGKLEEMAHLLKYDSNYGKFDGTVEVVDGGLKVDGKLVRAFNERERCCPGRPGGYRHRRHGVFQLESASRTLTRAPLSLSPPRPGRPRWSGVNDDMYDSAKHHIAQRVLHHQLPCPRQITTLHHPAR